MVVSCIVFEIKRDIGHFYIPCISFVQGPRTSSNFCPKYYKLSKSLSYYAVKNIAEKFKFLRATMLQTDD